MPTGDLLGHYRNVIWVSDNTNGDLATWQNSPIESYIEAGGNVLLMTRQGDLFLSNFLRQYLGVNLAASASVLYDCLAVYPGLTNIARLSMQTSAATFDLTLTQPESNLLYKAHQSLPADRGIGVWRKPAAGGFYRSGGGQFVFLSGRPYRWNATDLKTNVMYILGNFFREPVNPAAADGQGALPAVLSLEPVRPNPTGGNAMVRFSSAARRGSAIGSARRGGTESPKPRERRAFGGNSHRVVGRQGFRRPDRPGGNLLGSNRGSRRRTALAKDHGRSVERSSSGGWARGRCQAVCPPRFLSESTRSARQTHPSRRPRRR